MFRAMNISGSALTASKKWMELTSNNIVNMNTTSADGDPYRRQTVVLEEISNSSFQSRLDRSTSGDGVAITNILRDNSVNLVHDPTHPHANEEGYVAYPAVELVAEMTNLMVAQRMYEANINVLNSNNEIINKTLEIGR